MAEAPQQSRTLPRLEGRAGYWPLTLCGLLHPVAGFGDGSLDASYPAPLAQTPRSEETQSRRKGGGLVCLVGHPL